MTAGDEGAELRRANRLLKVLGEAERSMLRAADEEGLLHGLCRSICETGGYPMAWVGCVEPTEGEGALCPVAHFPARATEASASHPAASATVPACGAPAAAMRTGEVTVCTDLSEDAFARAAQSTEASPALAASISLPLTSGEKTFGALTVYADEPGAFDDPATLTLRTLACDLAQAVVRLRANRGEQRRYEAALHTSRTLLQKVLSSLNEAVFVIDPGTRFIHDCNRRAEFMFGYTRDELVGTSARILHVNDEMFARFGAASLRAYDTVGFYATEFLMKRKTGEVFHTEHYVTPLNDETGKRGNVVSVIRDITERKRTEQALAEERALLSRRVAERTAELSKANAELARATRLKDEFLANMSHELRSPLNAILGTSEAMSEQIYGPLHPMYLQKIRNIEESGRHLLALINDVLELSKIEAGKLDLQIGPVAVNALLEGSLQFVQHAAMKKRIKVSFSTDSAIMVLQADERRLKQVLLNLLSNAVKFTPEGGSVGLEVTGDPAAQVARFTVWDTGIGIAHEDLAKLFQRFVQLDSSLTRQYAGTGLGLSLVARMVEAHGGSVTVESEPGRGSRFQVALPWTPSAAPETPGSSGHLPTAELSSRRVFLVEDSEATADQLVRYMTERGAECFVHASADQVIDKVTEVCPDLIMLDVLLPGESGWAALERLKGDLRTRHIPVIVVSVVDEHARGLALGAAAYLVKPVSRSRLRRAVNIALRDVTAPPSGQGTELPSIRPTAPLVLLAEDNEANITTFGDYLQAIGYRVTVARNGLEALQRVREERPDVVLMDVQMPTLDGLEATRRLRQDPGFSNVPIIAVTALAMPGDRERCLGAGANAYLSKPVGLKQLVATIEALMGGQKLPAR